MSERLLHFGPEDRLSGILTPGVGDKERPILIFLTAGIVHRPGPNRLTVKLARHAAGLGFPAFRFDMSGIGECPPAPPGLDHEAQSVADTRAAIAHLREVVGARPVILAGLCSGADHAYLTAPEEEAVAGLFLMDPYAYEHPSARLAYLAKRAQDPKKLGRFLGNLSARLVRTAQTAPGDATADADPDNDRIAPPREAFGADLQRLSGRGVETCLIYSHSVHHLITAEDQFFSTFSDFDFHDRVSVRVRMEADHTYTRLACQKTLLDDLADWLRRFD